MPPVIPAYAIDAYWRSVLDAEPFPDEFILGVTQPEAINTFTPAAVVGPRVPEISMTNYGGSLTNVSNGATLERLIITGNVKPSVSTWTLRDSIVMGGVPAGSNPASVGLVYPLLDNRSSLNTDIRWEHVEVRPSFNSHEIYGFKGGYGTLYRSIIRGTVDGIQAHGQSATGQQKYVDVLGCLVEDLRVFADPNQSGDNITHNDGVQAQGALTRLRIIGSTIRGGRTSCILLQQQTGTYVEVEIDRNWLYGHASLGSTINTSQNGRGVICAGGHLRITNNRISKAGNSPFGGTTGQVIVSSSTRLAGTTTFTGNTYIEDGTTVAMTNGSD